MVWILLIIGIATEVGLISQHSPPIPNDSGKTIGSSDSHDSRRFVHIKYDNRHRSLLLRISARYFWFSLKSSIRTFISPRLAPTIHFPLWLYSLCSGFYCKLGMPERIGKMYYSNLVKKRVMDYGEQGNPGARGLSWRLAIC